MRNSSAAQSLWKRAVVTPCIGKHPNEVPEPFVSVPNVVQGVTTLPPLTKMQKWQLVLKGAPVGGWGQWDIVKGVD